MEAFRVIRDPVVHRVLHVTDAVNVAENFEVSNVARVVDFLDLLVAIVL